MWVKIFLVLLASVFVSISFATEVTVLNNPYQITSLRLKDEFYQVPMAHPSITVKTINVDAKTQRLLEISDVFTDTEKALTIIARISQNYLIKKLHAEVSERDMSSREEFIRIGTRPLAENYQHWNIHENFFEVTFDRAQVAPSYYGLQTVDIPLSLLREVLNPCFFNKSQQTL